MNAREMTYDTAARKVAQLKAKRDFVCPKCSIKLHCQVGSFKTHQKYCGTGSETFWAQVDKSGANGCWLYKGTIGFEGYGYVGRGSGERRKQYQAHRFAWIDTNGEIPKEKCLLHKCDVRHCVNPNHLYLGDRKDNSRDCYERGRANHRYTPVEKLLWPELSKRVKGTTAAGGEE